MALSPLAKISIAAAFGCVITFVGVFMYFYMPVMIRNNIAEFRIKSGIVSRSMESAVLVANIAIIPAICLAGLIGNIVNLIVLLQPEMKRSQYVYLTAMSFADTITLCLEMISGIGQGYCHGGQTWAIFDAHIHLPLGCITTSISVASLTVYTFERYIYARKPIASRRWCQPSVAKKATTGIILFAVAFNIPYFFAFQVEGDVMVYTNFAKCSYFEVHNWIRLLIFGILSMCVLLFVNGSIMSTLYRAHRLRQALFTKNHIQQEYRLQNRIRVIRILSTAVILFTLGELPTHFISRTSVYDFVFKWLKGYEDSEGFEEAGYRLVRAISTILMCTHYSMEFIFYTFLDVLYGRVYKQNFHGRCKCFRRRSTNPTGEPIPIRTIAGPC